jgi:phosphate transport system substrate-binding protein
VAGETDISNASRPIHDDEIASCQGINREPIEFRVGTDALAVTVSNENTFLTDVTLEQLAQIFGPAETWSDVDPSWPDEPILRFSPGTDSGTFDYFVESVMAPAFNDAATDVNEGEETILGASNLQLSEDDNVLVQGVEGSPYAIGYFGYAYYQENSDRLNILSVEGITPSGETVDNGTYPLARPLFIYSTAQIMQEKPQVAAFVYFYLTRVNDVIGEVGYFPTTQDALDAGVQAWMEALGLGM